MFNVLRAPRQYLFAMMDAHHIPHPDSLSADECRHTLVSHLLSGSCVGMCDPGNPSAKHGCHCRRLCKSYENSKALSFQAASILISASEDRLSDPNVLTVQRALGVPPSISRPQFLTQLSAHRSSIVAHHSGVHPASDLFSRLEYLPKGSLISVAQAHGVTIDADTKVTLDSLRRAIWKHLGTGACTSREGYTSHLACSSLETQMQAFNDDPDDGLDASTRLQIHIIRQISPLLQRKALRRLLELHNVSYVESDKAKQLRKHLKFFLRRLECGKRTLEGQRTRRSAWSDQTARIREQWPQVVPDHLKRKIIANFNVQISSTTQATYVCGCCAERCPDNTRSFLLLDDFDLELIARPRYSPARRVDEDADMPDASDLDDDDSSSASGQTRSPSLSSNGRDIYFTVAVRICLL
ncbi:hypothetical protein B0H11DRAFT_2214041 [Mycena galericulata]|nr:hypothetical protein B0H11DRAFT_2214041 [Mycena galericulata]